MRHVSWIALLAIFVAAAAPLTWGQGTAAHAEHHAPPAVAGERTLADGEVRRINRDDRKITLRHGPIANLDMPEMTMVFAVGDPAMLRAVNVGDKVRFRAERREGQLTLTHIEVVR